MRLISVVLEIAGHYRGKDTQRYDQAIDNLRRAKLGDSPIVYVQHDFREQPVTVPDFGHHHGCQCLDPQPHGVKRYFSVVLYCEGEPTADVLGDYELNTNARVAVCGIAQPMLEPDSRERQSLCKMEVAQ